jgi:natural product biosynthesis luciferase-like monooxygenase protein
LRTLEHLTILHYLNQVYIVQTQICSTLMELLRVRASSDPDHVLYSFLRDDLSVSQEITLRFLDLRARSVAAFIQAETSPGDRILLVYAFGPAFLEGFFGSIYAGRIPVPAYAPRPGRPSHTLKAICNDAQPKIVLTNHEQAPRIKEALGAGSSPPELRCCCVEDIPDHGAAAWIEPEINSRTIAFLQYTSGSTAAPKGVIVRHGNIIHNERMIQEAFSQDESSVVVSWLPLYHDMGLIGGVLQPLWAGSRCFLMSPQTFVQNPFQWLDAISRFKGTTSGGPDFAYRLCTARITSEQLPALDLSSWRIAFNGSEPVQAATLRQFSQKFEPRGFRRSAFVPCYGLAESTLLVTAGRNSTELGIRSFRSRELENNCVVPCAESDFGARPLVGCGVGSASQNVVIVNLESGSVCDGGQVGEILVSGPHVAQGYWNKAKETAEIFNQEITGREGNYLRTGDLGFVLENELFIAGRSRDLIVLRGRNFYPQDFEMLAVQSHEAFQSGLTAAFAVNTEAEPELVIVLETQNRVLDFQTTCQVIREAIVGEYDVSPGRIILVRSGSLPRTSSGKIRRQQCKEDFLAGDLKLVFEEAGKKTAPEVNTASAAPNNETQNHNPPAHQDYLAGVVKKILRLGGREIDPKVSLLALGLDSIAAAELKTTIAQNLKVDVSLESILQGISLTELAVLVGQERQMVAMEKLPAEPAWDTTYPLSQGQLAIWYLSQLSPDNAAYNIAIAVLCDQDVNEEILKQSFTVLMRRHEALRTVIRTGDQGPYQLVLERSELSLTLERPKDSSEEILQDLLAEAAERPFDLENGPLFRISIFRVGKPKRVLLFVFHHIIVDFLSLELILSELGPVYQALSRGKDYVFTTEAGRYRDYIEWQRRMLARDQGSKSKSFWHAQLQGELPVTELPSSRVRPAVQTYRGSSWGFRIDSNVTRVITAQAKALDVSLYSMLLAGFEILIHRYTWQPEITVGTPVSGRLSSPWEKTVGLFMNQVVLRPRFSGEVKISDFIRATHRETAAALEHQEYPFSLLVEQLQPRRDPSHSPLFQIMFSFYRAGQPEHKGLEGFLLGVPGIRLQVGDLTLCSMALENKTAQLDLTLSVAEVEGELVGNLQWNTDLFDRDAMNDVARHYTSLLEAIAANPGVPISDVALVKLGDEILLEGSTDSILQFEPEECVPSLIIAQIEACPSATALVAGYESLTYRELGMKAASLADRLRSLGIGPDVPVAIFASRSARLLTGILGTLFAGGTFVPIDPSMPAERAALMIAESHAKVVLTEEKLVPRLPPITGAVICLDEEFPETVAFSKLSLNAKHENLAYILFTSGSTGKPKGVMVSHGNLASFCRSMDEQVSCSPGDRFFASTSISFDISILELLWPLSRGAQVVLLPEQFRFGATTKTNGKAQQEMDFSVFYFSSVDSADDLEKYKLMIEGAKYADRQRFSAVWTPERHFHEFGGLFPNPSVTSAALATITRRIGIRAGSVVLPLHNPIRVAEEWAVVDNLSKGRVGLALASGWHADDFAFFPDRYEGRKELLYRNLKTLQELWRGEPVSVQSGSGKSIEVRLYPKPVQPVLPIWITAAGTPETFSRAGEIGANVLTHLLGQTIDKLAANIRSYHESRQKHGHDPDAGKVTLMLHTFLGEDVQSVRDQVRAPFKEYLRSSVDLIANLIRSEGLNLDLSSMKPKDFDDLLSFAFDRYFETSALFGTVRACEDMVSSLREIGVNEIACLVDFGVEPVAALASLREVSLLMENYKSSHRRSSSAAVPAGDSESRSILQCTPSMARILLSDSGSREFLNDIDTLLLGGETLPSDVAEEVRRMAPNCKVHNMYGPTETTIWSATHRVKETAHPIPIGTPLANTTVHILDNYGQPVPIGMNGEIYIGGIGVARGYVNSPSMTAEKFVPDAFSERPGMRLYRTGDLGRYKKDGTVEFLGRNDSQVKIRGFRIELAEIEAAIAAHPDVRQCVASVREAEGNRSLVAHVVSSGTKALKADELRKFLKQSLPEYMVPSRFIFLNEMPLNNSGKIDRKKLPEIEKLRPLLETKLVLPRDQVEGTVSAIWKRVLRIPELGIDDNFFELGGHSLLMVRTHREVEEEFQITIPLIKLLEHPTVRALAAYIRGSVQSDSSGELEERANKRMKAMLLQRENAARARSTTNVS